MKLFTVISLIFLTQCAVLPLIAQLDESAEVLRAQASDSAESQEGTQTIAEPTAEEPDEEDAQEQAFFKARLERRKHQGWSLLSGISLGACLWGTYKMAVGCYEAYRNLTAMTFQDDEQDENLKFKQARKQDKKKTSARKALPVGLIALTALNYCNAQLALFFASHIKKAFAKLPPRAVDETKEKEVLAPATEPVAAQTEQATVTDEKSENESLELA